MLNSGGTVSCFSRVKVELINSFLMDGQESLLAKMKMKFLSDVEFRTVDQDERKAVVQEKLYQQWRAGRHRFLPSLGTWDKITLRISSKHNKNMCFSKHFSCFCFEQTVMQASICQFFSLSFGTRYWWPADDGLQNCGVADHCRQAFFATLVVHYKSRCPSSLKGGQGNLFVCMTTRPNHLIICTWYFWIESLEQNDRLQEINRYVSHVIWTTDLG